MENKFHSSDESEKLEIPSNKLLIYPEEVTTEDSRNNSVSGDEDNEIYHSLSSNKSDEEQSAQCQNSENHNRRYPERERKKKEFPGYKLYETIMCH